MAFQKKYIQPLVKQWCACIHTYHNYIIEPHSLFNRMVRPVAHMGENGIILWVVVRKFEGKKLPGKSKCRWQDNIKMDLKETRLKECELDSFNCGQGHAAGSCETSGFIKCWEFHFSLSRSTLFHRAG